MIEIPEAAVLARQCSEALVGKTIEGVVAAASPHKFAWFHGDPAGYRGLLSGKRMEGAWAFGGLVELAAGDCRILFGDGVSLRYHATPESVPGKHQLCLTFTDSSALVCTVQMYGGMWAIPYGEDLGSYHRTAKEKPSPLSEAFHEAYFDSLRDDETAKLSSKAFLATEQRIPGLGNGVLQDILWNARIHPKRKMGTLSSGEFEVLYRAVRSTLAEMTAAGGRDTEKDLYGKAGGYVTKLSRNTVGKPCPVCGSILQKASYLGGAIYWCGGCQVDPCSLESQAR